MDKDNSKTNSNQSTISFIQGISTGKVVLAYIVPAIVVYFIMLLYTIPQVSAVISPFFMDSESVTILL